MSEVKGIPDWAFEMVVMNFKSRYELMTHRDQRKRFYDALEVNINLHVRDMQIDRPLSKDAIHLAMTRLSPAQRVAFELLK